MKKLIIIALVISSFAMANDSQKHEAVNPQVTDRTSNTSQNTDSKTSKLLQIAEACMAGRFGSNGLTDEENIPGLDAIIKPNK